MLYVGVPLWIPWQSPFNSFFCYSWHVFKPYINNVSFMRTFIFRLMTHVFFSPHTETTLKDLSFPFFIELILHLGQKKTLLMLVYFWIPYYVLLICLCVFSPIFTAPHSSTLSWKTPWTEEPGGLQSMGSRRVSHNWATSLSLFTFTFHFHFSLSCIGERNGNPLQCSCLENPRDRRAWWAAISGVTESDTTEAT